MTDLKTQSFRKHTSIDPAFHYVALIALLANLVFATIVLSIGVQNRLVLALWIVTLTVVLVIALFKTRLYGLKNQDRLIRLEERIRMDALLPEDLRKRIPELSEDQLIGLRFASDEELPKLVALTLDKKLDRKQIKERIENWRPDHFRI